MTEEGEANRMDATLSGKTEMLLDMLRSIVNLNDYYYTAPEVEVVHGYCDFFFVASHII